MRGISSTPIKSKRIWLFSPLLCVAVNGNKLTLVFFDFIQLTIVQFVLMIIFSSFLVFCSFFVRVIFSSVIFFLKWLRSESFKKMSNINWKLINIKLLKKAYSAQWFFYETKKEKRGVNFFMVNIGLFNFNWYSLSKCPKTCRQK